jgi:hypothetical protein
VQRAATAAARLVLSVDDLFDALEVRRKRAAVDLARGRDARRESDGLEPSLDTGERRVKFFQHELELVVTEVFKSAPNW